MGATESIFQVFRTKGALNKSCYHLRKLASDNILPDRCIFLARIAAGMNFVFKGNAGVGRGTLQVVGAGILLLFASACAGLNESGLKAVPSNRVVCGAGIFPFYGKNFLLHPFQWIALFIPNGRAWTGPEKTYRKEGSCGLGSVAG